jgi:hypothetical protein
MDLPGTIVVDLSDLFETMTNAAMIPASNSNAAAIAVQRARA